MKFYNINNRNERAGFNEAVMRGAAGGKGIYFPEEVPQLPTAFFKEIGRYSLPELAFEVLRHYTQGDVPGAELETICKQVFSFPVPVVQVDGPVHAVELYHGPSLSFKDIGAGFLGGMLRYYVEKFQRRFTVLVATSGDTGSAVAKSLHGAAGVDVVLLYPEGKVSKIQEKTLSTFGGNVHSLEIKGVFDDCQRLVKTAFNDMELARELSLTSANSINVARFLPQSIYYFKAWADLQLAPQDPFCISVPSGNFGNLTGGLVAWKMGLPADQFIAATNINRVVPDYLETGEYRVRPSQPTISNAMDVGDPSNFVRIQALFDNDHKAITRMLRGYSLDDAQTLETMTEVYKRLGYILDPHGAIGYSACKQLAQDFRASVFLETAHPAKFKDTVEKAIPKQVPVPENLRQMVEGEKRVTQLGTGYEDFKEWLKNGLGK